MIRLTSILSSVVPAMRYPRRRSIGVATMARTAITGVFRSSTGKKLPRQSRSRNAPTPKYPTTNPEISYNQPHKAAEGGESISDSFAKPGVEYPFQKASCKENGHEKEGDRSQSGYHSCDKVIRRVNPPGNSFVKKSSY